ncbi:MAG: hypothetical protein JSS78_08495 [Bacteroidetes bacterium]|nr:hypothetical protein [Bacteroidota bacterium]
MNRKAYYFGFLAFAALLAMSIVYYKERTMFSDMAFYLFQIVKNGNFIFFHGRFIAAFTEIFPLLAVKASYPLWVVALSYSVGVIIFNWVAYIMCGSLFKRYDFALLILFLNLLFVTDVFYWMISELLLGLTLLVVFFALLYKPKFNQLGLRSILASLFFIPVLVWAHPMILIAFSFTVLFFLLSKQQPIAKQTLYMALVVYVLASVVKRLFFTDEYDQGAYGGLKNFISLFPNYFTQFSQKNFVKNWIHKYYWIPVLGLANVVLYFRQKAWWKLILFGCYAIGFIMLINISFPTNATPDVYWENLYSPLAIIIGIPFVFDVMPAIQSKILNGIIVAAIIISGIIRINSYQFYKERLVWLRTFLQEHRKEKLLLDKSQVPTKMLVLLWGSSYEFWLLSTIENGQTASLIITNDANALEWGTHKGNEWLSNWGAFPYKELPSNYFKFSDSTSTYKIVK